MVFADCYATTDNLGGITSSPDSESMSPPMSTSPAVVPELGRHFSIDDAKLPTPVAVVSGSMNGISTSVQVDKTRSFVYRLMKNACSSVFLQEGCLVFLFWYARLVENLIDTGSLNEGSILSVYTYAVGAYYLPLGFLSNATVFETKMDDFNSIG